MKSVYEIAWDILGEDSSSPPHIYNAQRLTGIDDLTLLKMAEKRGVFNKLFRFFDVMSIVSSKGRFLPTPEEKDQRKITECQRVILKLQHKISLIEEIIKDIEQGRPHYPLEKAT